jgi:hypothetical protein
VSWFTLSRDRVQKARPMGIKGRGSQNTGQPSHVYETIANRIIEAARSGERDPDKLRVQLALAMKRSLAAADKHEYLRRMGSCAR